MVVNKVKNKRGYKQQSFIELILLVVVIVIANVLANQYYTKFDLTKEKRYTLSATSKELAKKIDDRMFFKVYLEGDNLSAKFKQLRTATVDMLSEFRDLSGNKIDYEFVNVFADKDDKEKSEVMKQLSLKGLNYYNDIENETDQQKRNLILPCAEVTYGADKEYGINLLTTEKGMAGETAINKSIENLEYEIANSIRKCITKTQKKIAFLYGHGEPEAIYLDDLMASLSDNYSIDRFLFNLGDLEFLSQFTEDAKVVKNYDSLGALIIQKTLKKLKEYDGIVVVKPTEPLRKDETYILDQYVMHGGKTVWMIDPTMAEHDSLRNAFKGKAQFPDWNNENLRTLLFNYGVRLNSNLLLDLNCNDVILPDPFRQGQLRHFPWVYYPVFAFSGNDHPITKNLEVVWGQYAGTLKPIAKENLKVTNLLLSTEKTKMQDAPAYVDLSIVANNGDPKYLQTFRSGKQLVGMLLEGEFKSNSKRPDKIYSAPVKESCQNSMVVIADGDIALNAVKKSTGEVFPLGFDRETGRTFANKKFLLNCFDYLFDESGLIEVRTKEINLRLLDKSRISAPKQEGEWLSEKTYWQILNTILPILAIILFGVLNNVIRKRKYAR
ncbi:MAG: gliding motility-associated ABC transporter substrate-binding protein GldG [Bacteroidetes bacterium]|nr:gliding motility-associated ABC transporter substrate-binding protein GldG [Bacteroidota bacterium]